MLDAESVSSALPPAPFEHVAGQVRPVNQNATYPLGMDFGAPQRGVEVAVGESQKKISEAGRIQDIRVQQRGRTEHRLLQAEFLVAGRQLIEGLLASMLRLAPEGKNVTGPNAPMRAHHAAGDTPLIEQLHEVGPRYL